MDAAELPLSEATLARARGRRTRLPPRWAGSAALLAAMIQLHQVPEASAAQPSEPAASRLLSPCDLEQLPRPARCGAFEVPENRDAPGGRRLSIGVAVVPASEARSLEDPIVVLMGGPGEDAISAAAYYANQFAPLLRDRDLLLVDQRGTGQSSALRCKLHSPMDPAVALRDFFPPDAVKRCANELSSRADLTQYTYVHFAHDLEHVRRTLGYGALNLFAGSYGTRAAQVFIRTYPRSVRTAYLGSVVPIDVPTPLTLARTTDGVLEATFDACAAEAKCRNAFPNLRQEFQEILARLESGRVRVSLPGGAGAFQLHRDRVTEWFRSLLYRPSSASALPWIIHRAHEEDWSAIAEGILSGARDIDSAVSLGLFFSITCNEDVPFMAETEIVRQTAGTVLGDYRPRQQLAACAHWPKLTLPSDYRTPVRSSVPALFVSGDSDAASPLWFTERVARGFENRAEVVLRGRGHTEWSDCLLPLYETLLHTRSVAGLDPGSCKPAPRPPFKLR